LTVRACEEIRVIVPIHSDDIPTGTLRSIERQAEGALGRMWLRKGSLHG
jgi:hypothetical protein